jgi:hypothetical protein
MSGQSQIRIKTGNALDVVETTANVAVNKAELSAMAANIDGKDVYPNTVATEHLSAANAIIHGAFKSGSMMVGSGGVSISSAADGETPTTGIFLGTSALQLIKDSEAIVALDGTTGDATFTGAVYATSGSFPGSIVTGTLNVGSGGITISGGTGGVYIGGNQIFLGSSGSPTVLLDGSTGVITASKFQLTADEDSTLDMSLGSLTIGASTSVGGTTTIGDIASNASDALSAAATAQETADGEIVGYYQTSAPGSGMKFGDIWIDTDYAGFPTTSAIYRYQDTSGGSSGALAWRSAPNNAIGKVYLNAYIADANATTAYNTATTKIKTFYQTTAPTATATGDLWVDTDDGNRLYRWSGAAWVSVQDSGAAAGANAIQPHTSGGVQVDVNKRVNTISLDSGGIQIYTATSGARVNLANSGMSVYNSSGTNIVNISGSAGIDVYNPSDPPGVTERISLLGAYVSGVRSAGAEAGMLFASNTAKGGIVACGYSEPLFLGAGLTYSGSTWSWDNDECEISAGDFISLLPGMNNSGTKTVYVGSATYTGRTLRVYGDCLASHKATDGSQKSNTTFTFYAASSSGGSPTKLHTVTFKDGLITSWSAA